MAGVASFAWESRRKKRRFTNAWKAATISISASANGLRSGGSGLRTIALTSGAAAVPPSHVQATNSWLEEIASATALARARSMSVCSAGRYRCDIGDNSREVDAFAFRNGCQPSQLERPGRLKLN